MRAIGPRQNPDKTSANPRRMLQAASIALLDRYPALGAGRAVRLAVSCPVAWRLPMLNVSRMSPDFPNEDAHQ